MKREHGGRRAAFAALLTTGMLAALLALTGIAAPAPAYAADHLHYRRHCRSFLWDAV